MIDKKKQKLVKDFLIEYDMTRVELARSARIGIRTLYNALHSGHISDKTYKKILYAMLEETLQKKLIKPKLQHKMGVIEKAILYLSVVIVLLILYIVLA